MKRKLILAANWKMHKTCAESVQFVRDLLSLVAQRSCEILIAPPFTALSATLSAAQGSGILVGAQNMHEAEMGAFTGEVSAVMLQELGVEFVLLGHSERRTLFKESDALVNSKLKSAEKRGLRPLLCIGESQVEHQERRTNQVLARQLAVALDGVSPTPFMIAYEPVWAIGTGKMATPEIAQGVHVFIRDWIRERYDVPFAEQIPILYGGSVRPETVAAVVSMPDIDGALVGGASLEVRSFAQMVCALENL